MRTHSRISGGNFTGLVLVCLALAIIFLCFQDLRQRLRFVDIGRLAGRIEKGGTVGTETILRTGARLESLTAQGVCLSDVVKAGVTLALSRLDRTDQINAFPQWVETADRTDATLVHAMSCLPTNGNFWLRLAMVRQAVAEVPTSLEHLVQLSQLYAPAEADVLRTRLLMFNRLSPIGMAALAPIWKVDVNVACGQRYSWAVRGLPPAKGEIRNYLSEVPENDSPLDWCKPS